MSEDSIVENYRDRVIRAVPCSYCGAGISQGCTKPTRFMFRRSSVALPYVHDHRSAAVRAAETSQGKEKGRSR